jgi:hypothetical protein
MLLQCAQAQNINSNPHKAITAMIEQPYHQPAEVAKLFGVSAFTVRRWCEWHGGHLDTGANPAQAFDIA